MLDIEMIQQLSIQQQDESIRQQMSTIYQAFIEQMKNGVTDIAQSMLQTFNQFIQQIGFEQEYHDDSQIKLYTVFLLYLLNMVGINDNNLPFFNCFLQNFDPKLIIKIDSKKQDKCNGILLDQIACQFLNHLKKNNQSQKGLQTILKIIDKFQPYYEQQQITIYHVYYLKYSIFSSMYTQGLRLINRFHMNFTKLDQKSVSNYFLYSSIILLKLNKLDMFKLYIQIYFSKDNEIHYYKNQRQNDSNYEEEYMHQLIANSISFSNVKIIDQIIFKNNVLESPINIAINKFNTKHQNYFIIYDFIQESKQIYTNMPLSYIDNHLNKMKIKIYDVDLQKILLNINKAHDLFLIDKINNTLHFKENIEELNMERLETNFKIIKNIYENKSEQKEIQIQKQLKRQLKLSSLSHQMIDKD